jgi:hypothetical protein
MHLKSSMMQRKSTGIHTGHLPRADAIVVKNAANARSNITVSMVAPPASSLSYFRASFFPFLRFFVLRGRTSRKRTGGG